MAGRRGVSNKSLPPVFEKRNKRFFRITNNIQIFKGTAIPWFGMPGGGTKMGFGDADNPTSIKTIKEQGNIEYIEIVELSEYNLECDCDYSVNTLAT